MEYRSLDETSLFRFAVQISWCNTSYEVLCQQVAQLLVRQVINKSN